MKFRTHPHLSDLLTLTQTDLDAIAKGEKLSIGGLNIELERVPKPDFVRYVWATDQLGEESPIPYFKTAGELSLKLVFDGETGKLKSAEVI